MPELQPIILIDPVLTIDGTDLKCLMSHVEMTPDVATVEVKTSCGVKEYPGSVKWTLKVTLYHSHETGGTNEVLTAAVEGGVPVTFTVIASSDVVSVGNPEYSGEVVPQPFAPIAGDVGDASSVDLEWSIIGWGRTPTMSTTPVAVAAASSSSASS